jgi:hypothetical protein
LLDSAGEQLVQLLLPLEAAYFPTSQSTHLVLPLEPWYWPCGHEVQFEADVSSIYLPAEQAVHDDDPILGEMKPLLHDVHCEAPPELYLPKPQSMHITEEAFAYLPASHETHEVALVALLVCEPAPHSKQESDNARGAYFPLSHSTHSVLLKAYSPMSQSLQWLRSTLLNLPLGHSMQEDEPVAILYLPAGQEAQLEGKGALVKLE